MILHCILLSLVQTDRTYLILGGSSASNSNNFNYNISNNNVYSYNFNKTKWNIASNPMVGSNGIGKSPWSYIGNKLNEFYQENIYFYDCARENAVIVDWSKSGKYYNLANKCLEIANNFTTNLNIIWQDQPSDSIYSYDYIYINTLRNLNKLNNQWFLSIFTFPQKNNLRWNKLENIFYLVNKYNNFYIGANLDGECLGNLPFNNDNMENMGNLWYNSLINKKKIGNTDEIFTDCTLWDGIFEIIFSLCVSIILIYCFLGWINYYKYRKTKHKYNQLIHN